MNNFLNKSFSPMYNLGELLLHYNDIEYINWYITQRVRLRNFRNIHQGEDCFIIGNGPSLKKMDLAPLKKYHTFGLNKIYLLFDKTDLNLSYHVAVNPLVIEQSVRDFETLLHCPSFLSYRPAHQLVNHCDHIYYIMTDGSCLFQQDLTRQLFEGYTVTYVAMQIAFYMGFDRVFLIGVDHKFTAKGKENEKQYLSGEDPNHFDPTYFSNQEWHLPDLEASELSYRLARFFYTRNKRSIYDATLDGKLNIFPKISYEQALQIAKRKI
jgi:hypothetical protein